MSQPISLSHYVKSFGCILRRKPKVWCSSVRSIRVVFAIFEPSAIHIHPSVSTKTEKMVACPIVSSRFNYCNSVLAEMSEANFNKLKHVQYTLACVVTNMPAYSRDHMTPVLTKLHWLPIRARLSSRSPWWCSRSARQSSHPTWRNWSRMLFHPGLCAHLHVVKALIESKKLCWSLVPELSATLQPKCWTLCQTMLG